MLGNEDKRFVGIDSFEFRERRSRRWRRIRALRARRSGDHRRRRVRARSGRSARETAVGVWYYDAAHSFEAQLEGLRIAEPLLVPGALVIVDDTDWDDVDRAMDAYVAAQARARRVLTIEGNVAACPEWWEGMQVLEWT